MNKPITALLVFAAICFAWPAVALAVEATVLHGAAVGMAVFLSLFCATMSVGALSLARDINKGE